jgi:hypothetical protein
MPPTQCSHACASLHRAIVMSQHLIAFHHSTPNTRRGCILCVVQMRPRTRLLDLGSISVSVREAHLQAGAGYYQQCMSTLGLMFQCGYSSITVASGWALNIGAPVPSPEWGVVWMQRHLCGVFRYGSMHVNLHRSSGGQTSPTVDVWCLSGLHKYYTDCWGPLVAANVGPDRAGPSHMMPVPLQEARYSRLLANGHLPMYLESCFRSDCSQFFRLQQDLKRATPVLIALSTHEL